MGELWHSQEEVAFRVCCYLQEGLEVDLDIYLGIECLELDLYN